MDFPRGALVPLAVTRVPELYLLVRARALPPVGQFSWARLDMAAGCGKVGTKALRKGIKSRCDMHATRIMF